MIAAKVKGLVQSTWVVAILSAVLLMTASCHSDTTRDSGAHGHDRDAANEDGRSLADDSDRDGATGDDYTDGGRTSSPGRIPAEEFNQNCVYDDECMTVVEETCLECIGCSNKEAINVEDSKAYEAAHRAVTCDEMNSDHCNNSCGSLPFAACSSGTCIAVSPVGDTYLVNHGDRACETSDDCMLVPAYGDFQCASCTCSDKAIAIDSFRELVANANGMDSYDCNPGPEQCEPCEQWRPECDDGICVARER